MIIKPLRLEDFSHLWPIEQSAHSFPWSRENCERQLKKKNCNIGLWENHSLVAFACIQRISPEAELLNIAVDPKQQGKGFGKQLLTFLLNELSQEKFERIFLEVRESNISAIKLYESLGFNQIGERPAYYPSQNGRETALLFGKEL